MKLKSKLLPIVAIAASAAIALPTIASCTTEDIGGGGEGGFDPITLSYGFELEEGEYGPKITDYEEQYGEYVFAPGSLGANPTLPQLQKAYFNLIEEHPGILAEDLIIEFNRYAQELLEENPFVVFYGRFEVTLYDFDAETGLATFTIFHKYYVEDALSREEAYINYVYFHNVKLSLVGSRHLYYLAYDGVDATEIASDDRSNTLEAAQEDKQWEMSWTFVNPISGEYRPYYMYWDYLNADANFTADDLGGEPNAADCFATWAQYGRLPHHLISYR